MSIDGVAGSQRAMFDWLERELAAIHTPRFHEVEGPADERMLAVIQDSAARVPESYRVFAARFGNCRFFRNARDNSYGIIVFRGPRKADRFVSSGLHIGFYDGSPAFIATSGSEGTFEICELSGGKLKVVAHDFEEWLKMRYMQRRKGYTATRWAEVIRGPPPFSARESRIVAARKNVSWRVTGIDADGMHTFHVRNDSACPLPVYTVGVRSKDGRLNGAVQIKMKDIQPGADAVVRIDCYKGLVPAENLEFFEFPDPRPEDREFFAEFEESD